MGALVEGVVVPIAVALIAAAVTVWKVTVANRRDIRELRDENSEQHASNGVLLTHLSRQITGIDSKVDRLDERLDSVQAWQSDHEKTHLVEDSL